MSSAIAVPFEDVRNAYNALTSLMELDSHKRVGVQEAVVVVRGEDGQLVEMDRVESMFLPTRPAEDSSASSSGSSADRSAC